MPAELCINLWFIADIGTGLCYNWSAKVYNVAGDDDTKTMILKYLAESDYTTAARENFAKRFRTMNENTEVEGQIPFAAINHQLDTNIDYFLTEIEKSLPKLVRFSGDLTDNHIAFDQKIPENPMFVLTVLMENEFGEIRPYTTEDNIRWYESEQWRLKGLMKRE